jgi:hypothetical protein
MTRVGGEVWGSPSRGHQAHLPVCIEAVLASLFLVKGVVIAAQQVVQSHLLNVTGAPAPPPPSPDVNQPSFFSFNSLHSMSLAGSPPTTHTHTLNPTSPHPLTGEAERQSCGWRRGGRPGPQSTWWRAWPSEGGPCCGSRRRAPCSCRRAGRAPCPP